MLERLGSGGMAVVFRGVVDGPQGFSRSVVIKRVLPELSREPSFVRMLIEEARLSALLHHPGIVQVHELGQEDGEYFLAMEYVDGGDLVRLFKRCGEAECRIPIGLVLYIVGEIAAALAYAHDLADEQGRALEIVHRDISPSNIMITATGGVKLLDFGIAKAAGHMRDERTRAGALKGKLCYLSPEQAEGLPVDRRTDVFALGIVMHECLTLARLFSGADDFEVLRKVRNAEVQPPSRLLPTIDAEVDQLVMRMLARRAEDRFQSCDEVLAALRPLRKRYDGDAEAMKRFGRDVGIFTRPSVRPPPTSWQSDGTLTNGNGELQATTIGKRARDAATAPPRHFWRWAVPATAAAVVAGFAVFIARGPSASHASAMPSAGVGVAAAPSPPTAPARAATAPSVAPVPTAAPSKPAAPPSRAATMPSTMHLRVLGPSGFEVLVDDLGAGVIPLDLDLPVVAGARRVEVRRSGYQPFVAHVAGDHDATVTALLEPDLPAESPPKKRSHRRAPTPAELDNPFGQ